MSLRGRLLLGMVVLVAAGLAVAAVTTYEEQRSFLLDRVDAQVESALVPVSFQLRVFDTRAAQNARGPRRLPTPRARRPLGPTPAAILPPGTFGELLGPSGQVVRQRRFSYGESAPPPPRLPARIPLSSGSGGARLFTVGSGADLRYRAEAFRVGDQTAVVAVPLREADQTLHRLVMVEWLVGAAVIAALIALGWLVIRLGLRPLERIGRVAAEIAGGDLSRRVSPADGRTEVGRLGRSLNEMLGQIERAFTARRESEDQLRHFLADASHELRTPLASIRGYAELFRLGAAEDPATLERAMARIESEAARMGVLVEDMLALSALDQAPEMRRVPVGLRELADQVVQDTRVTAPDREVSLSADEDPLVLGDPERLRRLMTNLMRNAVIHTPEGTPIDVAVRREAAQAVLTVRDHGPGVPQGATEQIFERFWRSERGRSRGAGGAGLGLAIVRSIAHIHGGEVTAADAPGGGAVFTVTLPAQEHPIRSQEGLSVLTPDSYLHRAD